MNRTKGRRVANGQSRALSHALESRLTTAYVAAAGVAGVGALTLTQPAHAEVIYTPAHVVIELGSTYHLDLNHDGATDFSFVNFISTRSTPVGSLQVTPLASNQGHDGNGVQVIPGAIFLPVALNRGARIGGSRLF